VAFAVIIRPFNVGIFAIVFSRYFFAAIKPLAGIDYMNALRLQVL
jgi:hypothetical protein